METKPNPFWFIAMTVVMLSAGGLGWWIFLNAPPVVIIPSPTLPMPNAYDAYLAAGVALVNPDALDTISNDRGPNVPTLAIKQSVVKKNQAGLSRLRVGLAEAFWTPPERSLNDPIQDTKSEETFLRLAYLLQTEGMVNSATGDWNGAAQAGLDGMKLGADLPHGGGLFAEMNGNLSEQINRKLVWDCLPHLTALQARSAARRLETICDNRFTFAQTLQEEKWTMQTILSHELKEGDLFTLYSENEPDGGVGSTHGINLNPLIYSKRAIYANYTKAIDAEIAIGKLPADKTATLLPPKMPPDPISSSALPGHTTFERYHFQENVCETQDIRLMTELALQAYRLDNHAYPETLGQLVPRYLSRVPDSPASEVEPLSYVRSGTRYILTHK